MEKVLERLMPHVSIILAGMLIVFVVLDQYNPSMGFLDNSGEKVLLIALAATSVINAIILIGYQRRT